MRRRAVLAMLGGAAVAGSLHTLALPSRRALAQGAPRVGWLKIQDRHQTPSQLREFLDGLRSLGHEVGRGIALEERYADGDSARLAPLAEELVRANVDVIVATSQPAVDAARHITRSVPIVGRMTDDPVQAGAAASFAQPGGNVTGVYSLLEEMSRKRLALLHQAVPSLRRVGALLTLDRGATRHWLADTEEAARQLGVEMHAMDVRAERDLETAFAAAAAKRVDGLIAFRNPTIVTHSRRVVELANRFRLPGIFDAREFAEVGGFMSYGPSLDSIFRRLATYVDKILKGERPGDIPIEQPSTFELVVNLKTAKALGIALPAAVLASADEVIE